MASRVIHDDDPDGRKLEEWLKSLGEDAKEAVEEVAEEVTEAATPAIIAELQAVHDSGYNIGGLVEKHPPLFSDVVKKNLKKKGYWQIKGGKATGKLWHIVNDGTYRTRPRRFMLPAMDAADGAIDSAWEKQRGKLGE